MSDKKYTLVDVLQGLIDTDSGIIKELKASLEDVKEIISRGSGSYAILDVNTPDSTGSGILTEDTAASNGYCVAMITNASNKQCIYSGSFSDIKYGHYAICARIKTNNLLDSNLVQLKVLNGETEIMSTDFKGTDFESINTYQYLYSTFTYEGNGVKNPLSFQLYTHEADGVEIRFDYVYVSMIIPSVYI